MEQKTDDRRVIDLTFSELAEIIAKKVYETNEPRPRTYVRGLRGIMEICHCSQSKASELHKSGILAPAERVLGRSFLIDKDLALDLLRRK
jgi:hypothetical protein